MAMGNKLALLTGSREYTKKELGIRVLSNGMTPSLGNLCRIKMRQILCRGFQAKNRMSGRRRKAITISNILEASTRTAYSLEKEH